MLLDDESCEYSLKSDLERIFEVGVAKNKY